MFAAIAGSTAAGFAVACLAAACYETGYALQAMEARTSPGEQALRFSLFKTLARRPRWVLAVGLTIAGWPLQLWALSLAPITVVQPTLALGLLLLLVLGVTMLHEHVGRREWLAVVLVIAGVSTIALAAPPESHSYDAGAGLIVALAVLGFITTIPWLVPSVRKRGAFLLVLAAGAADAWAAFASKLITDELHIGRPLAALAWALGAGAAVGLGFLCETTALQRRPATKVAPVILVMQIVIPVGARAHRGRREVGRHAAERRRDRDRAGAGLGRRRAADRLQGGQRPARGRRAAAGRGDHPADGAARVSGDPDRLQHHRGRRGQPGEGAVGLGALSERAGQRLAQLRRVGGHLGQAEAHVGAVVDPDVGAAPAVGDRRRSRA